MTPGRLHPGRQPALYMAEVVNTGVRGMGLTSLAANSWSDQMPRETDAAGRHVHVVDPTANGCTGCAVEVDVRNVLLAQIDERLRLVEQAVREARRPDQLDKAFALGQQSAIDEIERRLRDEVAAIRKLRS